MSVERFLGGQILRKWQGCAPCPPVPGAVGLERLVCTVSFAVAPSVLLTVGSFC